MGLVDMVVSTTIARPSFYSRRESPHTAQCRYRFMGRYAEPCSRHSGPTSSAPDEAAARILAPRVADGSIMNCETTRSAHASSCQGVRRTGAGTGLPVRNCAIWHPNVSDRTGMRRQWTPDWWGALRRLLRFAVRRWAPVARRHYHVPCLGARDRRGNDCVTVRTCCVSSRCRPERDRLRRSRRI